MMTPAKTSASGTNEKTKICQLLNKPLALLCHLRQRLCHCEVAAGDRGNLGHGSRVPNECQRLLRREACPEHCQRACPEHCRRACPEHCRRACPEHCRRACPEHCRRAPRKDIHVPLAAQCAGAWPGRRAMRSSQAGRSLWISGSSSKLCSGGGEDVIHSSVFPSQGSSPAVLGAVSSALKKLAMKNSIETAIVKAPMVEMRFHSSQPWPGW